MTFVPMKYILLLQVLRPYLDDIKNARTKPIPKPKTEVKGQNEGTKLLLLLVLELVLSLHYFRPYLDDIKKWRDETNSKTNDSSNFVPSLLSWVLELVLSFHFFMSSKQGLISSKKGLSENQDFTLLDMIMIIVPFRPCRHILQQREQQQRQAEQVQQRLVGQPHGKEDHLHDVSLQPIKVFHLFVVAGQDPYIEMQIFEIRKQEKTLKILGSDFVFLL